MKNQLAYSVEKQQRTYESRVEELNFNFRRVMRGFRHNTAGTIRHRFEVDMAHLLNDFAYAPVYFMPNLIQKMTNLLAEAEREAANKQESDN